MSKAHPGFKAVAAKIAAKSGVSKQAAGAILANSSRKASPACCQESQSTIEEGIQEEGLAMGRLIDLIPRICPDAIIKDMKRSLETARAFTAYVERWEIEHQKRMATDPAYARQYEESLRKWHEEQAHYAESEEDEEDY